MLMVACILISSPFCWDCSPSIGLKEADDFIKSGKIIYTEKIVYKGKKFFGKFYWPAIAAGHSQKCVIWEQQKWGGVQRPLHTVQQGEGAAAVLEKEQLKKIDMFKNTIFNIFPIFIFNEL